MTILLVSLLDRRACNGGLSMQKKPRCAWCLSDPLYIDYHDTEWGVPVYDDKILFTFLNLEGMQAGLNWLTVLKKRAAMQKAFANFNPNQLVRFDDEVIALLMQNASIIRNQRKIESVINNAQAYLKLTKEMSLSDYLWQFVDGQPIKNKYRTLKAVPVESKESRVLAKDLKQRGFKFVGPTICYAFMQAMGMVNDHLVSCYRYAEIACMKR